MQFMSDTVSAAANPMRLDKRRFVISGASSGIGRACAVLFSELGAELVLLGRDRDRLEQTEKMLAGTGHYAVSSDLSDLGSIVPLLEKIGRQSGPLDGIIHSAGIQTVTPIRVQEPDELEDLFRLNVSSAIMMAKWLRAKAHHNDGASLVLVASVAGLVGIAARAAYGASKAAVVGSVRSLAVELARDGIRVNCVSPGYVESEMGGAYEAKVTGGQMEQVRSRHLLGLGRPRDVAHAIAFLVAPTGRWITGSNLVVDGGYTCQ